MAKQPFYQFYCHLTDVEPLTFRILQVPGNRTLAQLGYLLMGAFNMEASHLYEWRQPDPAGPSQYRGHPINRFVAGSIDQDFFDETPYDAEQAQISQVFDIEQAYAEFACDFGDDWVINVLFDQVLVDQALPARDLPRLVAGAGYGMVENSGGASGLAELQAAFRAKTGSAYQQAAEYLGVSDFDLNDFDLADQNTRMRKLARVYQAAYEQHQVPSDAMQRYIQRR